ncbi:YfhO family protein [Anaerorhabdus furcosa]|uniref:Uncharacterized membrane protein YfhO n=1 Tax=Anaerorhabdus furcosa TaxID=118967 RepID=A0A1T4LSW9_9FIRM|nr:YfhO family protein [Anaerorhabdus furcosa]SJZ57802.1 Uncharacterized membrane protein YfhO [Anaerorhabdus furcosa]
MSKNKELKILLLSVSVVLAIYYFYVLFANGGTSLFWGDESEQVVQLYANSYELIKSGNFTLWNPSIGTGASQFTMFLSILGAPSFYLTLLCPSKEYIVYIFPLIDMLRFLIVAVLSYLWISRLVKSSQARVITSLSFTFCGWMMYWMHYPNFMDTFIYLSAILYVCEEMFEDKKFWLFSLLIAFIGILSLYQLYMISWLIFIYLICRYFMISSYNIDWKKFWHMFFKVFFYFVLGIGLGAIVIFPCVLILSSTNRIMDVSSSLFLPIKPLDAFRVLTSLFSPVINDFDYNLFGSPFTKDVMSVYTVYNYSLIIFPLFALQVFKVKFNGKKILITTMILLYLLLFFKFSYFVFNGNNSVRWSFYYNVFNCVLLAYLIENKSQWDSKLLKLSGIGIILFIICISIISRYFGLASNISRLTQLYVVPSLIVFIILYIISSEKNFKYIYILISAEILMCLLLRSFNGNSSLVANQTTVDEYHDKIFQNEIMDYINTIDDSTYYRMEFDVQDSLGYNMPLANTYAGFTSYVSIYNYESIEFYENRFSNSWFVEYNPSKFLVKSLLGNRYLVTNSESLEIPYGYTQMKEFNEFAVYKNSIDMNLGYATNKVISMKSLADKDTFIKDFAMMQGIVVDQEDSVIIDYPREVKSDLLNESFSPILGTDGVYIIDYSSSDPKSVCKYDLYYNGDSFDTRNSREIGYYALKLDKDYNDIYVYCASDNNPNHYVPVNVYWLSNKQVDQFYSGLNKQDKFYDVESSQDKISASISITGEDKLVATSIAYDDGWSVKVDGKTTAIRKVNYGFIGFDLTEGTHRVEFTFIPKGLILGIIVTVISIIAFLGLLWFEARRKRKA